MADFCANRCTEVLSAEENKEAEASANCRPTDYQQQTKARENTGAEKSTVRGSRYAPANPCRCALILSF